MKKLILFGLVAFVLASACSNHVDFGEQYKKVVYIVKSNNKVYTREHKIAPEVQEGDISIYCGGSDELKSDVTVTLVPDVEAMEAYNAKNYDESEAYKQLVVLPEEYYEIPSYTVTVKAGTEYSKVPIRLKTDRLDPDVYYAIPLSIASISQYEVNENLKTIFYQVSLINDFSGDYVGTLKNIKGQDTTYTAKDKKLKAMTERQVRTSIYNLEDEHSDLETNFMLLTVGTDYRVSISPWKDAEIEDLGNSVYLPEKQTFILHYKCKDASGKEVIIEENLVDSDVRLEDEEE